VGKEDFSQEDIVATLLELITTGAVKQLFSDVINKDIFFYYLL
jgi:hypothetical protein